MYGQARKKLIAVLFRASQFILSRTWVGHYK